MPTDYFVDLAKRVEPKALRAFVDAYLGGCGVHTGEDEQDNRYLSITLPGVQQSLSKEMLPEDQRDTRWIEVALTGMTVDVMTRMQDPFTNAIALGLALEIARKLGKGIVGTPVGDVDARSFPGPPRKASGT